MKERVGSRLTCVTTEDCLAVSSKFDKVASPFPQSFRQEPASFLMASLARRCSRSIVNSHLVSFYLIPYTRTYSRNEPRSCRRTHISASSELPQPRINYRDISENVTSKSLNALNRKARIPHNAIASVARAYNECKRISAELNAKRNIRSMVGERIRSSSNDAEKETARAEATKLKTEIKELEAQLHLAEQECLHFALSIPNDTHPNAPLGPESAAVTLAEYGHSIPSNPHRDHVTICQKFGLLDLESGSTVTGSSWYFLKNEAALLELALTNYAMSIAFKHGFTPVTAPDVVRSDIALRCGFQPRDDSDPPVSHMYHISSTHPSSPELVLSGTSEIPLAGMFANKVFSSIALPLKVVGVGHAFRAEAGARSADTRGLYRVHQFTKVELFTVTAEGESEAMMEEMMTIQKSILQGLGIPFRYEYYHISFPPSEFAQDSRHAHTRVGRECLSQI